MIEYTFAAEIPEEDKPIILESKIYKQWLEASEKKFKITKVHFAAVDYFSKKHEPLFIKLNATAFLPDGKPVHGIVLVRGHAVGVLVCPSVDDVDGLLLFVEVESLRLCVVEGVGFVYEALLKLVALSAVHEDGVGNLGSGRIVERRRFR